MPIEDGRRDEPREEGHAPGDVAGVRREQAPDDAADAGDPANAKPEHRRRKTDQNAADGGGDGREMLH